MRNFIHRTAGDEQGFVLILALVTLLLLTLFGVWALNSSDFENRVAGSAQQAERNFTLNEGANYAETSKVSHHRRSWIMDLKDIHTPNQVKLPLEDSAEFDRTGNSDKTLADAKRLIPANLKNLTDANYVKLQNNPEYWPMDNLEGEGEYYYDKGKPGTWSQPATYHPADYRYLPTYLICGAPPAGTDATKGRVASGYKFRIQAGAPMQNGVVETATNALGPPGCE